MSTTGADNKDVVRRLNDEIWEDGELDRIDDLYAEDYYEHNSALPQDIQGRDATREKVAMFHAAFSDITVTTKSVVADGDKVAVRDRFSGVHDGEFMGTEPTGERVEVAGAVIYRIEDGKAAEAWVQADMVGMLDQLGLGPNPPEDTA